MNEPRNIIWKGKDEPPRSISVGPFTITLPDEVTQRAGFQLDKANVLIEGVAGYQKFVSAPAPVPSKTGSEPSRLR